MCVSVWESWGGWETEIDKETKEGKAGSDAQIGTNVPKCWTKDMATGSWSESSSRVKHCCCVSLSLGVAGWRRLVPDAASRKSAVRLSVPIKTDQVTSLLDPGWPLILNASPFCLHLEPKQDEHRHLNRTAGKWSSKVPIQRCKEPLKVFKLLFRHF